MAYEISFIGNKLRQFGKIQVDVLLQDPEKLRPDVRETMSWDEDTSLTEQFQDISAFIQRSEDTYQSSLIDNGNPS